MVIISFGAGFNLESTDPVYLAAMRNISDYAAAKGIEMGGYDLLAHTRGRGGNASAEFISSFQVHQQSQLYTATDFCMTLSALGNASAECIGPDGRPDGSTCLASQGSDDVFMHINNFVDKTNWSSIETDGPFEGMKHNTQCLTAGPTHVRVASFAAACLLCCCLHPVLLLASCLFIDIGCV
jgi:hypothetical protein